MNHIMIIMLVVQGEGGHIAMLLPGINSVIPSDLLLGGEMLDLTEASGKLVTASGAFSEIMW